MKPVFKCDYCSKMGTEDEIREHEPNCHDNYDMKSCYTCEHKDGITMEDGRVKYKCKNGRDIPAGHIYKFCEEYKQAEKKSSGLFNDLFGKFF